MDDYSYLFKIVIIGESGVGKTNILTRLTKNKFFKDTKATIGVEFGTKLYNFGNENVKAQIWDTAGQERYRAITSAYYRGSYGAIIVYDVTNKDTFNKAILNWYTQLKENINKDIPLMLIGNKKDLKNIRAVSEKEAKTCAANNNMLFIETSALSGENVDVAFEKLMKRVYESNKIREPEFTEKHIIETNIKPKKIEKKSKKEEKLKYICC